MTELTKNNLTSVTFFCFLRFLHKLAYEMFILTDDMLPETSSTNETALS